MSTNRTSATEIPGSANGFRSKAQWNAAVCPAYADVLTVGCEPALLRLLRDSLPSPLCAVAHAGNLGDAMAYLRHNVAAVIVVDATPHEGEWREFILELKGVRDAPEVVVVAGPKDLVCSEASMFDGYNLVMRPVDCGSILREVAIAWLKHHDNTRIGGGLCSDA